MSRLLIIDDDTDVRESIGRMLRSAGYTVHTAPSGEEGFTMARDGAFDVILSDMRMSGISGLDVLRKLREHRVDSVFIIMTGFGTIDTAVEAMKLGAVDFVQKPFFRDELLMRVRAAAERRQLARQVDLLQRHIRAGGPLDALIGESVPALNCAALTESLLENELFGHGKGAFTGAEGARAGLIEHASGGTLFLDEIGTMSKALQAKLLRALEAGEVRRIGENDSRRIDVRFVAATNVDLQGAVDSGEFRNDLYYRLNLHRIHMPPLRERTGDLRLLVDHFLEKYGAANGVECCGEEAWGLLAAYSYPGNVRQLEHIIQRAVAIARGPQLEPDDLPEEVVAPATAAPAPEGSVAAARERADRETIVATLARHGGEIGAAARELQVSRTTMWRLMKKYGIANP